MVTSNKDRMSGTTFRKRFGWSVGITYALALVIIGLVILSLFLHWRNERNLSRFQHDFFAALSGNAEGMRYGRDDAKRIAATLREIPEGRLDEDFSDMLALALSPSHLKASVRDQMAIENFSKSERLGLYTDFMDVGNFLDTFLDMRMRLAAKKVLQGGEAPQVEGTDRKLILPFGYWVPWVFLVQFIAFALYAIVCCFARAFDGFTYGSSFSNYNPLFDLPQGSGSKVALLVTVPGSLPLALLIILLSAPSRIKERVKQKPAKRFVPAAVDSFSSKSSRQALERLKERMKGG